MKICVFSDIHGNLAAARRMTEIVRAEKPDKIVLCGDYLGHWSNNQDLVCSEIADVCSRAVTYLLRGNNDFSSYDYMFDCPLEENAVMYHFGRTLFFTHGHRYNGWHVPPVLNVGDVLVHGHTHVGFVKQNNGLVVANVGSVGAPRDGVADYMTIDEEGIVLRDLDTKLLQTFLWSQLKN